MTRCCKRSALCAAADARAVHAPAALTRSDTLLTPLPRERSWSILILPDLRSA